MKNRLIGLIPAAGMGTRLYPRTRITPKVLLEINGISLLQRNIEIMKNALGIRQIYIIVGFRNKNIIDKFGDGEKFGVEINYIHNKYPERGLADGILLAKEYINSNFCVILGDELYYESNHSGLIKLNNKDFVAVCSVKETNNPQSIKKNYSVEIQKNRITSLTEKPRTLINNYLGCGTYLFGTDIFDYLEKTPVSERTGKKEITDTINLTAISGEKVLPFFIDGEYVNVNSIDDFNYANFIVRNNELHKKKISLIIPAYNESASIGYVIDDFKKMVDEIIVVDNNSSDDTSGIAKKKGAIVYNAVLKGYGDALRYGMDRASGDIFILTEADGSFSSRDISKILEYLKDADMVVGTRTTKQMIEQAANLKPLLRIGNVIVAKIIEFLWWRKHQPRLTDVGCTYRGIWRDAYLQIKNNLTANGPEFSPEMIIEPINHGMRLIEIPVSYHGRIGGESKFSSNVFSSLRTGLRMLLLILKKKFIYIMRVYIIKDR